MSSSEHINHAPAQAQLQLTPGMRKIVLRAQLQLRKAFAWYRALPDDDLQRINAKIEHALAQFNAWLQLYKQDPASAPTPETTRIFVLAPLEFTQQISLQQTLELLRFFVQLLEEHVAGFTTPGTEQITRDAVALYAKEIAFSAASVYAKAADPARTAEHTQDMHIRHAGALALLLDWCAAVQSDTTQSGPMHGGAPQSSAVQNITPQSSLVQSDAPQGNVAPNNTTQGDTTLNNTTNTTQSTIQNGTPQRDSVQSDSVRSGSVSRETFAHSLAADTLRQLGWDTALPATALVGSIQHPQTITDMRYTVEHHGGQCLIAQLQDILGAQSTLHFPEYLHCGTLVQQDPALTVCVVSAHSDDLVELSQQLLPYFDSSSVCVGSTGTDDALAQSLCEALSAVQTLPALITPQRIVYAHTVLPERALIGDPLAKQQLIDTVLIPLIGSTQSLDELTHDSVAHTVAVFLRSGSSLETTAQLLHIHPNTVRYRLKRSAELTGWDPLVARDAYVLLTAISLGLMRHMHQ